MSDLQQDFLGTGFGFPPSFERSLNGVEMLSGQEDIESSLEILLSTRVGERVMQPGYGCNLDRLLFEPLNTGLKTYMKDLIRTAILYYEPRIVLDDLILTAEPEEGRILLEIIYTISGTNSRFNFVYPYYLLEGSDI